MLVDPFARNSNFPASSGLTAQGTWLLEHAPPGQGLHSPTECDRAFHGVRDNQVADTQYLQSSSVSAGPGGDPPPPPGP